MEMTEIRWLRQNDAEQGEKTAELVGTQVSSAIRKVSFRRCLLAGPLGHEGSFLHDRV